MTEVVEKWKRTGLLKGLDKKDHQGFADCCENVAKDLIDLQLENNSMSDLALKLALPVQRKVYPIKIRLTEDSFLVDGKVKVYYENYIDMSEFVDEPNLCLCIEEDIKKESEMIKNK